MVISPTQRPLYNLSRPDRRTRLFHPTTHIPHTPAQHIHTTAHDPLPHPTTHPERNSRINEEDVDERRVQTGSDVTRQTMGCRRMDGAHVPRFRITILADNWQ